jgi:hypothetical protein
VLDGLPPESVAVLHDRRIPGSRANIDHLVITTGGVWVIDSKRYSGQPELRVEGGWFRPRVEMLRIGGRDGSGLVDGVLRQVELVRAVVDPIPVTGVLCFIDAEWPLFGGSFITRQVHVLWPKKLLALLKADTGSVDVPACQSMLTARFPPT